MIQPIEINTKDISEALTDLSGSNGRLEIDPDTVEQDLARLVLGLVAFLRQLMELQAIRQMENGNLTDQQEEKLGTTLMRAETAIYEVAAQFNLAPEDLSLDLGPLGKTI
ncbi:gas vesicle protein K [Cognatiyoonia sp. IB215182]|uniref:gas vesicle protein K n=1 Tax=Cognatiyoonia sp. IB215182 TaxID=3097353 RepID=UPI002A0DBA2F|nr:gas vesicle protein K [Cognatiyoonia sp. IB215182]MDX8351416.1 gas vesicle protein K [Cognatiyoonia sp. IB215182]